MVLQSQVSFYHTGGSGLPLGVQKSLKRMLKTLKAVKVGSIVDPKKLETGLRTISAGIPYTLLLRIEAMGFPTFGLLL